MINHPWVSTPHPSATALQKGMIYNIGASLLMRVDEFAETEPAHAFDFPVGWVSPGMQEPEEPNR